MGKTLHSQCRGPRFIGELDPICVPQLRIHMPPLRPGAGREGGKEGRKKKKRKADGQLVTDTADPRR